MSSRSELINKDQQTVGDLRSVRSFFYPHGGLMVWMFVTLELLVFGIVFCIYFYMKQDEYEVFVESQKHLNQFLATLNTLILITSGYVVALVSHSIKDKAKKFQNGILVLVSALLGVLFLVLKLVEYQEKINSGFVSGTNSFFSLYWLLTGFHAAHVFLGVCFLLYFSYLFFVGKKVNKNNDMGFDTVATYWHMCDLIWVLLFPIVYLL